MDTAGLLTDHFVRIRELVHATGEGLSAEQLNARLDPEANSIAWLLWHLTRVQDDHVADAAGTGQVWATGGWRERFTLPRTDDSIGYGDDSTQVGRVRVTSTELLTGYYDAVCAQTLTYLGGLTDAALDRIVDERWDPPVSLGARLISVIGDDLQHVGQAAFVRGILLRR